MNTIAFVYKWTHIPTLRWYVGSRTSEGCHPDDGYICGSKIVEPMIRANPHEWERTIIATGEPKVMYDLETEILQLFDAMHDPRSFNQHNNQNGKFSTLGRPSALRGRKRPQEENERISESLIEHYKTKTHHAKGVPKSVEHKQKIGDGRRGKTHSQESIELIREAAKVAQAGAKNGNYKGTTVATHLETGEVLYFNSRKEMEAQGFDPSEVSRCILGKRNNNHKKYFWKRIEK